MGKVHLKSSSYGDSMGGVCVDVSPQCLSLEAYSDRARKVWRMTGNECEVTCKHCLRRVAPEFEAQSWSRIVDNG